MKIKTSFFLIITVLVSIFTACEFLENQFTLGMGDPIDFEPPVLRLDHGTKNPMYVGENAKLSGYVKDNIAVDRVILRNAVSGDELFEAEVILNHQKEKCDCKYTDVCFKCGDRWEIDLAFDESYDGKNLPVEIVAYDKVQNSGETSIKSITIIIDLHPPIIELIWIQRTILKREYLYPIFDFELLEEYDPKGEISEHVNKYQNGYFHIEAKLTEMQTRIRSDIKLNFYDSNYPNDIIYTVLLDGNPYSPKWLVSEEEIINNGRDLWGQDYWDDYYINGKRYYYSIEIEAYDLAENRPLREEEGFLCMWAYADNPKGVLDRTLRPENPDEIIEVSRGTPLPVEFFDDDSLEWAYADLFTIEQWGDISNAGSHAIAPGVFIPQGDDDHKLDFIRSRLRDGLPVNNWKYSKRPPIASVQEAVTELIGGKERDEKLYYVQTGNQDMDYGHYVLFTLVQDKKLSPNIPGDQKTQNSIIKGYAYRVEVKDQNAPLIVIDTVKTTSGDGYTYDPNKHAGSSVNESNANAQTGDSPEENTFPVLTDNRYFDINGYTLREDKTKNKINKVIKFRMAWIPDGVPNGPDSYIEKIQTLIQKDTVDFSELGEVGQAIQWWNFSEGSGGSNTNHLVIGAYQDITGTPYIKQTFRKRFDILGGNDNLKSEYKNFHNKLKCLPNCKDDDPCRENTTKLFIIYAEDNMGNVVFRELRLLGNHKPPELVVYDISGKILEVMSGIPNLNNPPYNGIVDADYHAALSNYNKLPATYSALKTAATNGTPNAPTIPFQMYTRETTIKYWVTAERSGDLAVKEITMKDITLDPVIFEVGSGYNTTDRALSFCEYYPDEMQRIFLFEAEDTLGNIARVQRTIAITNAARLDNITTTHQSGTYGIYDSKKNNEITLMANFSGQVRIQTGTNGERPELNVRYQLANGYPVPSGDTGSAGSGNYVYRSIQCEPIQGSFAMALEFKFIVPEGAQGRLETMYDSTSMGGNASTFTERPIRLSNGAQVIDHSRNQPAFIPGYTTNTTTMPNWTTNEKSLQNPTNGKIILLDGIRPVIKTVTLSGKSAYAPNDYYFKTGEIITLTLSTSGGKEIKPANTPVLQYYIMENNGSTRRGPYTTAFAYNRPSGLDLVFSLEVNSTGLPYDGKLTEVTLYTGGVGGTGAIEDSVGNSVVFDAAISATDIIPSGTNVYIKKSVPLAPVSRLGSTAIPTGQSTYNNDLSLTIDPSSAPLSAWEDVTQYSTNGGLGWTAYSSAVAINVNGSYSIRTRYLDRAGNEGTQRSQDISLNKNFPRLIGISADEGTGWFLNGKSITFNLDFEAPVRVATAANVTITFSNRNVTNTHNEGGTVTDTILQSYQVRLQANTGQTTARSTIKFTWPNITGKEMRDGLYIKDINLNGLLDNFDNAGGTGSAATYTSGTAGGAAEEVSITGTTPTHTCANLGAGFRVDSITPRATERTPAHEGVSTSVTPTSVTITFSEPVMRGSGTVTIRPRGNYAIPPVFEEEGYYLGIDGTTRYSSPGTNRTYISSLYDIYNNSALSAADRNLLTQGTTAANQTADPGGNTRPSSVVDTANPTLSRLVLNERTGQSFGPYIRLTHGLTAGPGYTGDYAASNGSNAPDMADSFMVPDTSTKWVLDYKYGITQNVAAVNNIRATLNKAKFRWQEIDIVSVDVPNNNSATVTINFNEPLLRGLQWDVYYPEGAFTDLAGNNAPASGYNSSGVMLADNTDYWFWSDGVQTPVIRVNRRSYDGRNSNWYSNTNRTHTNPTNTGTWAAATAVTDTDGWGILNFNNIHYRVESETPGASLTVGTYQGATANKGAVTAAWSGNVQTTNSGATVINDYAWDRTIESTAGTWTLNNLIRRGRNNTNQTYTVLTRNGTPESRTSQGTFAMYRSFNRDLLSTELSSISLTGVTNNHQGSSYQGILTFGELEASKSYIAAQASRSDGTVTTSAKGYEGVFRTVIALLYTANRASTFQLVEGSNVKNGMPSIAGFPVQDAAESGDNRFVKAFFRNSATQFYWVSTEIVCEWYFLRWGGGGTSGTHMSEGEVNNYLTVGYGDLTYGFGVNCSGENAGN